MKFTRTIKTVLFISVSLLIGFSVSCSKVLALENPTVPTTPSQPTSNNTSGPSDGTQTASSSPTTNPTGSTTADPTTANGSSTNGTAVSNTNNQSATTGSSTVQNDPTSNQTTQPNNTVPVVGPTLPNTPDPCQVTTPVTPTTPIAPTTREAGGSSSDNNTVVTTVDNACAASGNASVINNLFGGNATSGSATDIANLINAIASADNLTGGALQTFIDNITNGSNGNITINPADFINVSGGTTVPTTDMVGNNNTTINNDVNLSATSGNAGVNNNQVGGSATTGNALTEANIINMLDSIISDQQAFLGIINISGNLNGNIELPSQLVDALLTPTISGEGQSPMVTSQVNNSTINNNVNEVAQSGNANVTGNVVAGNATTGNATNVVSVCNIANSQIVGGNVLLVFVNVLGTWVGVLLNEPIGTTNAALGGQIVQDTSTAPSTINATNNNLINNVVNLRSVSGNATVAGNQIGGNATTGNATTRANIVNLLGTNIDLTGWFGILVINVFGSWNGSLTIAPSQAIITGTQDQTGNQSLSISCAAQTVNHPMDMSFINPDDFTNPATDGQIELASFTPNTKIIHSVELSSSKAGDVKAQSKVQSAANWMITIVAFSIAFCLLVADKIISIRKNKKTSK